MIKVQGISLPLEPLSNHQLDDAVRKLGIKGYSGAYVRDRLPNKNNNVCGIINMDDSGGGGTHWTCWYEDKYFDGYGLPPPEEMLDYMFSVKIGKNDTIVYSTDEIQPRGTVICGHLCLYVLKGLSDGRRFEDIVFDFI